MMSSQLFSERLSRKTILFAISLGFSVNFVIAEVTFCGTKEPDAEKVCISTRLPWQSEPIYFCTDKGNIKYRNQCGSRQLHCENNWHKDTLLVATPWDCCTIASVPDQCHNAQCPPKPFNRTCEILPPKNDEPWDCCPRYACQGMGEGAKGGDCHLKQLEPGCMSPPENKTNCVGFIDSHVGCCTQFQCDGDGKPGMCPMQMAAMKYSANAAGMEMNSSPNHMPKPTMSMMPESDPTMSNNNDKKKTMHRRAATMKPKGNHAQSPNANLVSSSGNGQEMNSDIHRASGSYNSYVGYQNGFAGGNHQSVSIAVEPHSPYPPTQFHLSCTGDYNCPGNMLCCSSDMSIYSDGSAISRNMHPTYGYCVEPAM